MNFFASKQTSNMVLMTKNVELGETEKICRWSSECWAASYRHLLLFELLECTEHYGANFAAAKFVIDSFGSDADSR